MPPQSIQVQGWNLVQFPEDPQPRIHEYDLARRLEMARERNIRLPFERLRKAGKFNDSDVRQVHSARNGAVKRTDPEYWYNQCSGQPPVCTVNHQPECWRVNYNDGHHDGDACVAESEFAKYRRGDQYPRPREEVPTR